MTSHSSENKVPLNKLTLSRISTNDTADQLSAKGSQTTRQLTNPNRLRTLILRHRFQKSVSRNALSREKKGVRFEMNDFEFTQRAVGTGEERKVRKKAQSEGIVQVLRQLMTDKEFEKRKEKKQIESRLSNLNVPYHPDFGEGFVSIDFQSQKEPSRRHSSNWAKISNAILGGPSHQSLANYLKSRNTQIRAAKQARRKSRKSVCFLPPQRTQTIQAWFPPGHQELVEKHVFEPQEKLTTIKASLSSLHKGHSESTRFLQRLQTKFTRASPRVSEARSKSSQRMPTVSKLSEFSVTSREPFNQQRFLQSLSERNPIKRISMGKRIELLQ